MPLLTGLTADGTEVPVQVEPDGVLVAEGLQGPQGVQGDKGDPGQDAVVDMDRLVEEVLAAITFPPRKVAIADGASQMIIAEDTYGADETIVIDIQAIQKAAGTR